MNVFSFVFHQVRTDRRIHLYLALIGWAVAATACYSFRGGSVPEHLSTVSIATAVDNSGFGDPRYREYLTQRLVTRFRSDNSLQVVEDQGDARLTPVIVRIQDRVLNVGGDDLEGQRRITVAIEVEYFDAVKNRQVWKRTIENFDTYSAAAAAEEREEAVRRAIDRVVDDILLAVVSNW